MKELQEKIIELQLKQQELEIESNKEKLLSKLEELKKLVGTVEVRIYKTSKKSRYINIVHHISYNFAEDLHEDKTSKRRYYILKNTRNISIHENTGTYKKFHIEFTQTSTGNYDSKLYVENDPYNGLTAESIKTISVEEFNAIASLSKIMTKQILDGIINADGVRWVMNGGEDDVEFKEEHFKTLSLDFLHILLGQEESWYLRNNHCRPFLHHNIYLITPNSLKALDNWIKDEVRYDSFAYAACQSAGERWRGSRIDKYRALVKKINEVYHGKK